MVYQDSIYKDGDASPGFANGADSIYTPADGKRGVAFNPFVHGNPNLKLAAETSGSSSTFQPNYQIAFIPMG